MEYSEKFGFNLPSRDSDDIADINQISDNFRNIDENILSKQDVEEMLKAKQDTLASGINIKTVNHQTILGEGNIDIENEIEVDQTYNPESENAQSGKAVAEAVNTVYDDFGTAIDVRYTWQLGNDGIYILPLTRIQAIEIGGVNFLIFNDEVVVTVSSSLDLQAIGFVKNKKYRIEIRDQKVVSLKSLDEIVDKNYNPKSENAQSGKAVAEAIGNIETALENIIAIQEELIGGESL